MSWVQKLYETYEYAFGEVGRRYPPAEGNSLRKRPPLPLLPVFHTTQKAQIQIAVDYEGHFLPSLARVVAKAESVTVIPCTEASAGRTNRLCPHPLFDKLQYIAGDYSAFGGRRKSGYDAYMAQLNAWCDAPFSHPLVRAVRDYLQKGCLVEDLVRAGVLVCGAGGGLMEQWACPAEEMPEIFRVIPVQSDAFVRFAVYAPGQAGGELWLDETVRRCFIAYQNSLGRKTDLCYVLGRTLPVSVSSPTKIRSPRDKAKLISANDQSGFTYRGRFLEPGEAVAVSSEAVQKAHNALKWLIDRQGYENGGQVILAWGTKGEAVPPLAADTQSLYAFLGLEAESERPVDTEAAYARRLRQAIAGCRSKGLEENADIVVMGLDAATPGRIAVTYYRELKGSDFLERVLFWHRTCSWRMVDRNTQFIGAPSPLDIVWAAYGDHAKDSLKHAAVERLLPCIVDGARFPEDLMRAVSRRASNPLGMEAWEYGKAVAIACAVVRKYYNDGERRKNPQGEKEVWSMTLDELNGDRSYLFGRVLAYYQYLEAWALGASGQNRVTNALRLKPRFARAPLQTAKVLEEKLNPYFERLGNKANRRLRELNALYERLREPDEQGQIKFSNVPLRETYLLGYRCQMEDFWKSPAAGTHEKEE